MTTLAPIDAAPPAVQPARPHRRRQSITEVGIATVGLVVALIVATDGSVVARIVRPILAVAATAGAIRLSRPPRGGSAIALVGGAVGIVVGATFGPRFTAFGESGWRPWAGWISLAAGAVVLVEGLRRSASGRRPVGAVAHPIAHLAVVAIGAFVATPPLMATNVPPVGPDTPTPADVLGAQHVFYPSGDGVRLSAWFVPAENRATVIIRHGAGRNTAVDTVAHADVLMAHGFGVLLTDARGHGDSGGRAMDFGWDGERDVIAAVAYLETRPEVDPARIAVLGLSMGGEEALGAMALERGIAAVVAEGATARVAGDSQWLPSEYGWRGHVQRAANSVSFALTDLLTDAPRPDTLANSVRRAEPRPVLLIAAGDVPDEAYAARHIAGGSPAVEVWVVPGAQHTGGLATDPDGWEHRVVAFLRRALGV